MMTIEEEIEMDLVEDELDYLENESLAHQGIDLKEELFIKKRLAKAQG